MSAHDLVVELPDSWVVSVVEDILLKEVVEANVGSCLWLSHEELADSQDSSDKVK